MRTRSLTLLPGRLPADAVFPAGRPGHEALRVTLPAGEHVRVVRCAPAPDGPDAPLAARADAPAAVFIHGWGCSAYSWHRNLRPVADAGWLAVAPDLRGHGWSDKPLNPPTGPEALAGYTTDELADMVRATCDALGVRRAVVVGHSMGGAVALRLAQRDPARVAALVLVAAVGFGGVARTWWLRAVTPRWTEPLIPRIATRPVVALGVRLAFGRLGRPTARDVEEYWAPTADPRFPVAMRRVAHGFDWGAQEPEALAGIACPVHCLFGGEDGVISLRDARSALAHLREGRVEVVEGAGHVVPEEAPEVVNASVLEALRTAAARTAAPLPHELASTPRSRSA